MKTVGYRSVLFLAVPLCSFLLADPALAGFPSEDGPNHRGTLLLAVIEGAVYTTDNDGYCNQLDLGSCSDAVTRVDQASVAISSVLAAFNPLTNPRVTGVTFGWTYPDDIIVMDFGPCGSFELSTSDWPAAGAGTAVTFAEIQESTLVDVYWVAAYDYYGTPASLELGEHPTQGAYFSDDSIPAILDEITRFGSLGFYVDGEVACPPTTLSGACCFDSDLCEILLEDECDAGGGQFQGWGSDCEVPCGIIASGSCCFDDGECRLVGDEEDCLQQGGIEFRSGDFCETPCQVVPTLESSWGEVKSSFRR